MREGASAFLIAIILFELYDFLLFKIACSVTQDPLDIRHDLHLVERNFSGFSNISQSYCTLLHGMIY